MSIQVIVNKCEDKDENIIQYLDASILKAKYGVKDLKTTLKDKINFILEKCQL